MTKIGIVGDPHGEVSYLDPDVDAILLTGDIGGSSKACRRHHQGRDTTDRIQREAEVVLDHYSVYDAPVYTVPGNWDGHNLPEADTGFDELLSGYDSIHNVDGRSIEHDDIAVTGYGAYRFRTGPETLDEWDWQTESFTDAPQNYTQNRDELEAALAETDQPTILLSHNVAFDSGLDIVDDTALIGKRTGRYGLPCGSDVVSTVLEDDGGEDIILSAGCHIHESRGAGTVGDVPVINPGENGVVYADVVDGELDSIRFE